MRRITIIFVLLIPLFLFCQETAIDQISYDNKSYVLYPKETVELPDIPSPFINENGVEVLTAFTKDTTYLLFPVTIENGDSLNYKQYQYGKGFQLKVDGIDFPSLAKTGLHDNTELLQTKNITGKSIEEITKIGRPGSYSSEGFMSKEEDIISVLKYDNLLVETLGLSHPQLATPLYHLWNVVLQGIKREVWLCEEMRIEYILYNGREVFFKWQGGRGWQESLFNDEILGQYHLEMWIEMDQEEKDFLMKKYPDLSDKEMADLINKLSYIHCGEMLPYYVMRYGFYEGHTNFRADPIAIAFIFGLRSLEEIDTVFNNDLFTELKVHHNSERK